MKEINFATHNLNKVRELKAILEPGIKVNHFEIEYPEMRSDDPCKIVKDAVKKLADKYGKPMVAEDSGIFIRELNGFPGTCSAYIHKRIGLKGILKLMEGASDRACFYRSAVGYCEPGREPVCFLGEEEGTISEEIRGCHGFGHDPIFIPDGMKKTYGEMSNAPEIKKFRRNAVIKLKEYLNNMG